MQSYTHFTLFERESLQEMVLEGVSVAKIAEKLGRNRSSIYRELKRNGKQDGGYHPWWATSLYLHRRKKYRRRYRLLKDKALLRFVKKGLDQLWPPETIVSKWKLANPKKKLSHSTIYRAISSNMIKGYAAKTHLRRRGKRNSPWQRGSNENMNGILRFFFPRGTDFHATSPEELSYVLELINNRPRKCLGWLSPLEVFSQICRT